MNFYKRYLILLGILPMFFACDKQTVRKEGFEVHGIDVSHYQKHIDWTAIAAQDIQFAFVKATEGETMRDTLFCKNWFEIKDAGIKRGAYHFYRPGISPEKQAVNFLSTTYLEHGDLAPVLDVEVTDGASAADIQQGVQTWLTMVGDFYKIRPIIYTNQKFFNKYLAGYFTDYPIWIARYSSRKVPELEAGHDWHFWQYGNRGRLHGIHGDVDFNVFQGGLEQLENFCLKRPEPLFIPAESDAVVTNP